MIGFGFDTISNFDKHISDSIRGYDLLDDLIINICSFFAKDCETVVDLGCTTGRLIHKLAELYPLSKCVGYDIIDNNFKEGKARLIKQDIVEEFNFPKSNIILSVFTLQFLKVADRINVLNKIYHSLNSRGVFIVCEKEISNIGLFQEVFTFANYDYKRDNFSSKEILEKENQLRSVMNSLSVGENVKFFKMVGFNRVESFFQSLNFKGWLCMK